MSAPVDVRAVLRATAADLHRRALTCRKAGKSSNWSSLSNMAMSIDRADAAIAELLDKASLCAVAATPADDSTNDGLYVVRARYVHDLRAALYAVGGAK